MILVTDKSYYKNPQKKRQIIFASVDLGLRMEWKRFDMLPVHLRSRDTRLKKQHVRCFERGFATK